MRGKNVNCGTGSTMEKASWRAGKTAIMYDLYSTNIRSQDLSKTVFCVAGANQDATSTRRCDLTHDPIIAFTALWTSK